VPFNFLVQYLETGEAWYLDAAEFQCRHQGDIDTNNVNGHPYKHAPLHTTWYADIAHMFLRGLVVHYWCTGEERSLEMARKIADHIAPLAESFREFGNERQIGWGLYALTGIYEATLDERYLNAATKLCDTLVSGMSPTGKFKIRWDNRMSLMNGMAMNGMMSVQELSGSEKLADGLMRLSTRTLGFYPEYAPVDANAGLLSRVRAAHAARLRLGAHADERSAISGCARADLGELPGTTG
jgi:hypothetical protein